MTDEEAFLRSIIEHPADRTPRLVYADWLDGVSNPRAVYLRLEEETVRHWRETQDVAALKQGLGRMSQMLVGIDPVWAARISRPPQGVCCDRIRFSDADEARPRLTNADLDWLETRHNLTLPPDYRAFLLNYNGGVPEPSHFRIPGRRYDSGQYEIATHFCMMFAAEDVEIDSDFDLVWRLQHLDEYRDYESRWQDDFHRTLMVVGQLPSLDLDWICLQCRGESIGPVYAMAAWLEDDAREEPVLIAPGFAAFLDLLMDHDEPHIQAIRSGDVPAVVKWLDAGGDSDEHYQNAPLLHHAVRHGQAAIVRELLIRGASIWDGFEQDAIRFGHPDVAELLRQLQSLRWDS